MPRYQLLAVDVDGTLVNSHDELTPATREALIRAGRAGVRVVVATGRRYSRSIHLVEPLGIDVPIITAGGALVKDPEDHRTLFRADFDPGVLGDIVRFIEAAGFVPVLFGDTFDEGFDFYHPPLETVPPPLANYLDLNPGCGRVVPDLVEHPPDGVFAGFVVGSQEEMSDLERAIQARFPGALATHVLRSPRYTGFFCEIAPAGITKWSAVARLADLWQIPYEAICAVGDDVNDIPMIEAAALGVAMGNALPAVRKVADRIAPTHDEDGLVTVVEWILDQHDSRT